MSPQDKLKILLAMRDCITHRPWQGLCGAMRLSTIYPIRLADLGLKPPLRYRILNQSGYWWPLNQWGRKQRFKALNKRIAVLEARIAVLESIKKDLSIIQRMKADLCNNWELRVGLCFWFLVHDTDHRHPEDFGILPPSSSRYGPHTAHWWPLNEEGNQGRLKALETAEARYQQTLEKLTESYSL